MSKAPTPELQAALEKQKVDDAEEDLLEVICRALEIPRPLLARVLYAYQYLTQELKTYPQNFSDEAWLQDLPSDELREALQRAMMQGARRVVLRRAILAGQPVSIKTSALIPHSQVSEICNGCPERMPCVAENRSTPQQCWEWRKDSLLVYPLKLKGNTVEVEAQQPAGRHTLPLSAITLKESKDD